MTSPQNNTSNQNQQQFQSQSTTYSPWVTSAGQNLYDQLASQYPSWTAYSGPTVGAFGAGTGTANNYATNNLGVNNPNQTGAGNTLQSIISSINPSAGPGQYFNPYVQLTLGPTLQNIEQQREQQQQQNGAGATLAGAFGGTGQGVGSALSNRFADEATANAAGQAYSNAFNSAIQQQQQSLQTLLGAAGGQTSLGSAENQNNLSLASLLAGIGAQQQQANQTGIQNAINLNTQNQTMPLQQGQTLASILAGIPKNSTTSGFTNSSAQSATPNNSLMGLIGQLAGGAGNLFPMATALPAL